jgi:molecular chaperone DnaK (HSP70)
MKAAKMLAMLTIAAALVMGSSANAQKKGTSGKAGVKGKGEKKKPKGKRKAPSKGQTLTFPLGIKTVDGFVPLIKTSESLPRVYSETFSTGQDDQQRVQVKLSQKREGGFETVCDVIITGLPKMKKGLVRIIVTLEIDRKKKLRVKATVQQTAKVTRYGPFQLR